MKKLTNSLLALAAIMALVATAVGLGQRLVSAKANKNEMAAVLEKNAALKAHIASLMPATPPSQQTGATEVAEKSAKSKNQPAVSTETFAQQQARFRAFEKHKLNDREFGLKYYAALRSDVDTQYGPFYRLQHLTKAQTNALAEALFQRQLRYDKMKADKLAAGRDVDWNDMGVAMAGADEEFAAASQEALGEDFHGQFLLYERQRPAWDYVGNLGGLLSLVDMPMSFEQASRLANAIAGASPSFQNGEAVRMTGLGASVDWGAVDAVAADFLSPEQLDFFKNTDVSGRNDVNSRQIMELNNAIQRSGVRAQLQNFSN